ncbi:unnamed protein product [Arctogadus glacialis]
MYSHSRAEYQLNEVLSIQIPTPHQRALPGRCVAGETVCERWFGLELHHAVDPLGNRVFLIDSDANGFRSSS